jgi:hypothetical protein
MAVDVDLRLSQIANMPISDDEVSPVAARVIEKCGGAQNVAEALKIDVSSVYKFTYPKSKGGRGGLVPAEYQQPLIDWSKANGKELRYLDFFERAKAGA